VYGFLVKVKYRDKDVQEINKKGKKIDPEKNKSFAGGCVTSDCQPYWYCERDKTKF
jgi:hypothetical protein